jgi:molybdenum cofactor cytidylyltransferase
LNADLSDWSALILAAGSGSRFGAQKLLADLSGKPLIVRTAEAVCAAGFAETLVVTGAEQERVTAALADSAVATVHARDWGEGMAASIRTGVGALRHKGKGLFLILGDMPLFDAELCVQLAELAEENGYATRPMVGETPGHPVCFLADALPDLLMLSGDQGAGALLRERVGYLPVTNIGAIADIDTPSDLAALTSEWNSRFTSNTIDNAIS